MRPLVFGLLEFEKLHSRVQNLLWAISLWWPCHQMASRSFSVRGRQVPLCARCTGLLIGPVLVPAWLIFAPSFVSWFAVACFFADSLTQLFRLRESTNWVRLTTGATFFAAIISLLRRYLFVPGV